MRGTFARRKDVLPQVMTWHELDSGSLRDFRLTTTTTAPWSGVARTSL